MIIFLLFLLLGLWYLITLYFFYFKTNFILGQDKMMVMTPEEEYTNYPIVYFRFKSVIPNLIEIIKNKTLKNFKKSSNLKVIVNNNSTKFDYLKISDQEIIDFTFKKIKNVNSLTEKEIISETISNPNKVKFFVYDKGYIVCFSHLFYDGMNAFNVAAAYCDFHEKINLPFYYHIPIYAELNLIKSGISYLNNSIKKNFNYYPKYSKHFNFMISLKKFKRFKKEYFNKVNFSLLLSAIKIFFIFNSSNIDKITLGIVVAFSNKTRRNNFTALPMSIIKPDLNMDNLEIINNIVLQLVNQSQKNEHYVKSIYTITNIYDLNLNVNKSIDILLSGFPMCKKLPFSINNIELESTNTIFRYTSMPVYIYHMSDLENIHISYNLKTDQIDYEKLKKYSNDTNTWLESILINDRIKAN